MSEQSITSGTYFGHVVDYGVSSSKDGKTAVVGIKYEFGPEKHQLWWSRPLKDDKMMEVVAKTLLVSGYKFDDLSALYDGLESRAFEENKTVELVVEDNEYNGKVRTQIAFVNEPGGGGFRRIAKEQGKVLVAGLNVGTAFALAKKGATPKQASTNVDDIPF